MFQIDDPSATSARPARPAPGAPGWFRPGDPATGALGTRVRDYWLNTVQAELLAVLAAAGVVPNAYDDAQLLAAIRGLRPVIVVAFAASQTWVVPTGVTRVRVTAIGGGGAGAGTSATNGSQVSVAPGGNAAPMGLGAYIVTPGEAIPITIGGGGGWANGQGGAGAASSFGSRLSAPGGQGAGGNPPSNPPPLTQSGAGVAAISVGGDLNTYERPGHPSQGNTLQNFLSGRGADSPLGPGGAPVGGQSANGASARGYGAGGSGGASGPSDGGRAGGYGGGGLVIVEY